MNKTVKRRKTGEESPKKDMVNKRVIAIFDVSGSMDRMECSPGAGR